MKKKKHYLYGEKIFVLKRQILHKQTKKLHLKKIIIGQCKWVTGKKLEQILEIYSKLFSPEINLEILEICSKLFLPEIMSGHGFSSI